MMQHRYRLLFTYILFSLEMLGNLLRPFFLGLAVNDLIKGSYNGLVLLSAVHLGWLILGKEGIYTMTFWLDKAPTLARDDLWLLLFFRQGGPLVFVPLFRFYTYNDFPP
ncbi:MAG: hypothetical protein IPK57_15760 [Chitinophagaceae bacterium]|nr:hypothetical protein [Chitinophagaceae bacterium]